MASAANPQISVRPARAASVNERSLSLRPRPLFDEFVRHGDGTERFIELTGFEPCPRLRPVPRCELEVALTGPVGHHADDFGEVTLGLELVETAAGDEGEEYSGRLGVVV